ncbi:MAG: hypothetical protein ACJA1H_001324, partial [Glaciecola sp.]
MAFFNPNISSLRYTTITDTQDLNRLEKAIYFL